jgi:centrosomal protein CEP76
MLVGQSGIVEDHCHLLCSLLLGFGLKAYVCVGTAGKGEHSWVMSEGPNSITFWECTKGVKLDYFSHKALTYYKTINAVYNNK